MKSIQRTILCMVDLSPGSQRVLQWATDDAVRSKSELIVVYPYRLKALNNGEQKTTLKNRLELEAYSHFDKLKDSVSLLKDVPFTFSAEVGFETDRLEAHMRSKNISLLVMGKDVTRLSENQGEWADFLDRLTVPVVLIP